MKLEKLNINYSRFNKSLITLKEEYDRYCEIRDNVPSLIKFIREEFKKRFKHFKIKKVELSEWGGICIWTNIKDFDFNYYNHIIDLNIIQKTNFKGSYIWICTSGDGVAFILKNENRDFENGKIKFN